MAQFTRTNGDLLPVFHMDTGIPVAAVANAIVSGASVHVQGPKLDYFTVTATGALTGTQVSLIITATQQLATVYIYEYTDTTNDTVGMAVYPTGAWTTTALQTAINAQLTAGGVANTTTVTSGASFVN